jgi:hypothetical protein
MKKLFIMVMVVALVGAFIGDVTATPRLQTHIIGSNYNDNYEVGRLSWVTSNQQFDLKVVGYWQEAYSDDPFLDYRGPTDRPPYDFMECYAVLSVPSNQSGTIWINGVEVTAFDNYFAALPEGLKPEWYVLPMNGQFAFEDVGRIDNDQVGAMDYSHGSISTPGWGDEILVNVVVNGYSWTDFRAVGVDSKGNTYVSEPGSESSYSATATPEPGTLSLLGIGLLGLVPLLRSKKSSL